jgi:DNA invertase Pin-like site-specific DNA recombinase
MTGHVWAYARVSTRDQNPQLQLDALAAHGYDTLVTEKESGKRGVARPAWEELVTKPVAGDTLKFWKSDRWGRSAGHVLTTVTELRERGVKVVSLTENFDLDTKEGRFMFAVLAAAAEYELELRAERQAEGIAAAQRRQAEGKMLPGK